MRLRCSRVLVLAVFMAAFMVACVNSPAERGEPVTPPATATGSGLTVRLGAPQVSALAEGSRASLARSRVPMFVLPAQYAQQTMVMEGEQWTALSYRDDEIAISLHATGTWHDAVDEQELAEIAEPNASARGLPAWETVNEGIRSLAWNQGDVAYALEIECTDPEQDVRCTESTFLSELGAALVPAHDGGAR